PPQGHRSRPRPLAAGDPGGRARRSARGSGGRGGGRHARRRPVGGGGGAPRQATHRGRAALHRRLGVRGDRDHDGDFRAGRTAQRPRGTQAPQRGTHQMSKINVNHHRDADEEEMERTLRAALHSDTVAPPSIVDAAEAAGLLDVAYARLDSPVGTLVLASTPQGLARLAYVDEGQEDAVMEEIAGRLSPRMLSAPRRLDEPRRELDEYFAGRRRAFDLTLDLRLLSDFTRRILDATARIPYGEVATYKDVAAAAGSPRGSRAAGNALGSNPLPIVLPCHRVVHSSGGLGGYTGGVARKRVLLAIEGRPE